MDTTHSLPFLYVQLGLLILVCYRFCLYFFYIKILSLPRQSGTFWLSFLLPDGSMGISVTHCRLKLTPLILCLHVMI